MIDDAFKGCYRPDRVQFYRTKATNSQIGDLIRHEDELIAKVNRLLKIAEAVDKRSWYTFPVITSPVPTRLYRCAYCEQEKTAQQGGWQAIEHTLECPVTEARAIRAEYLDSI